MILRAFGLLLFAALPLAANDYAPDRALEEQEARLQVQRATALHARLITFTDELDKLHAKLAAAGDTAGAAMVEAELDAVKIAMERLAGIARFQTDPAAAGEVGENEQISPAALAARRINAIVKRFTAASAPAPVRPAAPAGSGTARPRVLRMDKARIHSDYAKYRDSAAYWGYESTYAQWTLTDLTSGEYEVVVRYSAGPDAGGKAVIKVAGQTFNVTVPKGEKGGRELKLTAGTVTIQESGADVRVENAGIATKDGHLWKLDAIVLQPVAKRP